MTGEREYGGIAFRRFALCEEKAQSLGFGVDYCGHDFIRTIIHDKYSGSMTTNAHLDHISHCKTASGTIGGVDETIEYLSQVLATIRLEEGNCLIRPLGRGARRARMSSYLRHREIS